MNELDDNTTTAIRLFESAVCDSMTHRCGCPLTDGPHIGVALSGGADSVALLAALVRTGYNCVALHCNFMLRGDESDGDERYCRDLVRRLGVEIETVSFDTLNIRERGESVEMACRRLRYDWFERRAKNLNLSAIAIAHHREDAAETLFINLLRGTGPKGMSGLAPRRGIYVRPMLQLSRPEIEAYLAAIELPFRTDSSNLSNDYRRNALRNVIIPQIVDTFPNAMAGIDNTIEAMAASQRLIDNFISIAARSYVEGDKIDVSRLVKECDDPFATLYLLLRRLYSDGCSKPVVKEIIASADESGRTFLTLGGMSLELSRGVLQPLTASEPERRHYAVDISADIAAPIAITSERLTREQFDSEIFADSKAYFDAAILAGNPRFELRHWRKGDRIKPFGMNGSRKLSDIFSDLKYSLSQKNSAWLLTRDDEIIWVVGVRASRLFKVTDTTTYILRLSIIP